MKRNLQVANKKDSAQEERYPKIDPKTGINGCTYKSPILTNN